MKQNGSDKMQYIVKIEDFEGPLDLLLHLVKNANIDIEEINICEITNQYLEYIHKWEELNIDIASEYLVMASTLMEIKSKSLLPSKEEEKEEEEEETKESLIKKLVEYQKYKEITKDFKKLENKRKEIYTKAPEKLNSITEQKITNDTDTTIEDLTNAFIEFLKRKDMEKPIHTKITNKEYSVKKRKDTIKNILKEKKKVEFSELFEKFTKSYIIVTFLAILELAREDNVVLIQENNFDKIMIEQKV